MKRCPTCKDTKPLTEFGKDKHRSDGLTTCCKSCKNKRYKIWRNKNLDHIRKLNREHVAYRKKYYQTPEIKLKHRKRYIERTFNISYDVYEKMLLDQNEVCAICKRPETSSKCKYLSIDHCHTTNAIRGLLCVSCNRGIGMFWDNIELLKTAITYLNKNKNHETHQSSIVN